MNISALTVINPGTTDNFVILAGSTITNTGATSITGSGTNIGLFPGTSFTNKEGVTSMGSIHINNSVASTAKDDLVTVFNQIKGITPVTQIASELGGTTLLPGVYDSADGTFKITGILTLDAEGDANAIFIFKTESTLITASDSKVNLINDAEHCQVFWQIGSSVTLGTDSSIAGHIYAETSITATTRAAIQGQLLAKNGAVTLDTNTISNNKCVASIPGGENGDDSDDEISNDESKTETTPTKDVDSNGDKKETIIGGKLPITDANVYQFLFFGICLTAIGTSSLLINKYYEKAKKKN